MAATFRDARYGWEIFKESGYTLTFAQINGNLVRAGFRPVSMRTYQHYHKLFRYGYEEYLPINQLDVRTLSNPVWDAATRNRYALREVSLDIEVRLVHKKSAVRLRGFATRISDAVVVVRLEGTAAKDVGAAKIKASDQRVELVFLESGEILPALIESIYAQPRQDIVTLRLGLVSTGSIEALGIRTALGTRPLWIKIEAQDESVYLSDLVQSLYWMFQALDAARAAGDEILMELSPNDEFNLAPARVKRLSLQSPLEVELLLAAPAILMVLTIVKKMVRIRNDVLEGDLTKQEVELSKATTEKVMEEARTQAAIAERLEQENAIRLATSDLDTEPVVAQTFQLVRGLLSEEGVDANNVDEVSERIINIVQGQVRPAAQALLEASGDAEITFTTDLGIEGQIAESG